jgi:DNA polymerase-3 subunit epsilon
VKQFEIMNTMEKCILVVDIETTGFLTQGGKIVEIGIVKLDLNTGKISTVYNSLIREEGLDIRHTQGRMGWIFKNSDLSFDEVMQAPSLESQKTIIQSLFTRYQATAFNKAFDFDFLRDRGFVIKDLPCPMLVSTPICKIPSSNGYGKYKWPKVEEAWDFFFGKTGYVEAHRGCDDAEHEAKIVYELYKMGEFDVVFKDVQLPLF